MIRRLAMPLVIAAALCGCHASFIGFRVIDVLVFTLDVRNQLFQKLIFEFFSPHVNSSFSLSRQRLAAVPGGRGRYFNVHVSTRLQRLAALGWGLKCEA